MADPTAAQFWEARYADTGRIWSRRVNQTLAAVTSGLPVGRALDLGCGEGADAIWLALQGWLVIGIDISSTGIARAAEAAAEASVAGGMSGSSTIWPHGPMTAPTISCPPASSIRP